MKRIICFMLTLVMTLGLFTGCKKKNETTVKDGIPDHVVELTIGIPQNTGVTDYKDNAFKIVRPEHLVASFEKNGASVNGFIESFINGKVVI